MRLILKLLGVVVLVVIVGVGFLAYNAYVAFQSIRDPGAAPPRQTAVVDGKSVALFTAIPPDRYAVAVKEADTKVERAVANKQAFALELTGTDMMALANSRLGDVASSIPVDRLSFEMVGDHIALSADVRGAVPVPVSASLVPSLEQGKVMLAVRDVRIGLIPAAMDSVIGPAIQRALDVNDVLTASGAVTLQEVQVRPGVVRIVGLQRGGAIVEADVANRIRDAASRQPSASAPATVPGGDVVPPGAVTNKPGAPLYLALGDSLTAGVGVQDTRQAFVSRVHGFLEKQVGRDLGLTNLGISGESTSSFLAGNQMREARATLDRAKAAGGVTLITLGIGANDVLGHLASPDCQADPTGTACQGRIQVGLKAFPANYRAITQQLATGLDPSTRVILVNVYNPFNLGLGLPAEKQANDTVKALNDVIAAEGQARGWKVADANAAIGNRAGALTGILSGDVHPNAQGYQAIAFAGSQAYGR